MTPDPNDIRRFARRLDASETIHVDELLAAGILTEAEIADPLGTLTTTLRLTKTETLTILGALGRTPQ